MTSTTQTVARYSALLFGITYGLVHQGTLQTAYDAKKAVHAESHRSHLEDQARAAWLKKQMDDKSPKGKGVISDPEDPSFDLEALVNSWAETAK